jgi:hypothetical protein
MITMSHPPCPTSEIFCSPKIHPCLGKKILYTPDNQLFSDIDVTSSWGNDSFSENSSTGLRKRKVRFAPPCFNEYSETSSDEVSPEEENHQLWWSQEELEVIMDKALQVSNEARDQPIVVGGLDQALELAISKAAVLGARKQLESYLSNVQEEERGLKLWCQYGHSRRGLEKFTSIFYNDMRKKDIYKLTKMVMVLKKKGAEPELIRQVSEQTSRSSVVFARMLAIADHKATSRLTIVDDEETVNATEENAKYPSSA